MLKDIRPWIKMVAYFTRHHISLIQLRNMRVKAISEMSLILKGMSNA